VELDILTEIVLPPKEPYEATGSQNWLEVESALKTSLPRDYKDYINSFGSGQLGELLWVFNPFASDPRLNLLVQVEQILGMWRSTKAEYGEVECPYPLYPEPDGLLPWGYLDTGGSLYWQTSGLPEEWIVVLNESRGPKVERFHETMTGFLTALLSRNLPSNILPVRALRGRRNVFVPTSER